MALKLLRCHNVWVKLGGHPCWRVQSALDDAGIEYEVVRLPWRRGKREEVERISGQRLYPVIVFEDGTVYREESKEMRATIEAGKLMEKAVQAEKPRAKPARGKKADKASAPPPPEA